ncbi:MAG: DegQ family serine endoprotease [bacterium]
MGLKKRFLLCLFFLTIFVLPSYAGDVNSFAPIVKKVESAVVNVSTTEIVKQNRPLPFDFFREFFGEDPFGFDRPQSFQRQSLGSGVIISPDGYILTNNHVVKNASIIKIRLYGSKEDIDAKLVGQDPKIDLALLKIDSKQELPYAVMGDSDSLQVGDWVIAIGNPFGLSHTVTKGIVSAKGRVIGSGPYDDFIQTDAPINFGNSGGPLFNLNGEVVGINTAIISGGQGIGFAIPINMAKSLLPQLKEGKIVRGYLGIRIKEVTKELAESFGIDTVSGALVEEVVKNSPAEKAGIKEGDIILEIDGKKIEDAMQLPKIVAMIKPETKVNVKILRDKSEMNLKIVVGKQGDLESEATKFEKLGIRLSDTKNGVVVEEVLPNSLAVTLGIKAGDYIVKINNVKVDTVEQVAHIINNLASNAPCTIQLRTARGSKFVTFRMP